MQLKRNIAILAVAALVFTSPAWGQSASTLLQEGIFAEETVGDLDAAIKIYERIVDDAKSNRAYAAQAQYRVGACYLKQGRKDRAVAAFQKLIDEFPKQSEIVAQARTKLTKLGYSVATTTASLTSLRKVWAYPGLYGVMAPSPDGRYVAFRDRLTGDLALRDLATGTNRRLTHNKEAWEQYTHEAEISPDGKSVVYTWGSDAEGFDLRMIGLDGSRPRVLFTHEEVITISPKGWSQDGRHILARLDRKDRTRQIVMVSVADGTMRVLKSLDWRYVKMRLSPDGRYVAYDLSPNPNGGPDDIFLLATDGSSEIPLVEHPADDDVLGWAPDGKSFIFRSDRRGTGEDDAWAIQISDGKPQGSPQLIMRDVASNWQGPTRDGAFFYRVSASARDVYTAELDPLTGKVLTAPAKVTERSVGRNNGPDWSPDGKYLAYYVLTEQGRGAGTMVIRSLDSGQERELSPPISKNRFSGAELRWSPDGRSILRPGWSDGHHGLYRVDAQTGDFHPVVQMPRDMYTGKAAWSPDGKTIFYNRWDSKKDLVDIVALDLETGNVSQLHRTVGPEFAAGLVMSPDGKHLAYLFPWSRREPTPTSLLVIPTAGGEPRELVSVQKPGHLVNGLLAWTPDGRYLLFGKERKMGDDLGPETSTELWRVSAEDGAVQKIGLTTDGSMRELRIHPDGRRIAFTVSQRIDELWTMENLLQQLTVSK